jgi:hypothetical protein
VKAAVWHGPGDIRVDDVADQTLPCRLQTALVTDAVATSPSRA